MWGQKDGLQTSNVAKPMLVLGYDATCAKCSRLADRIATRLDHHDLELVSLADPRMVTWRKKAFGEDPPWAPTLVEVDKSSVRGWTGLGLGTALVRRLGGRKTIRVLHELGQAKDSPEPLETGDNDISSRRKSMSRSSFFKALGGGIVAVTALGQSSAAAKEKDGTPKSVNVDEADGNELNSLALEAVSSQDIRNVMDISTSKKFAREAEAGQLTARTDQAAHGHLVKAAYHTLADGNSATIVAFIYTAFNGDAKATEYIQYQHPVDSLRTGAYTFQLIVRENQLKRLDKLSESHHGVRNSTGSSSNKGASPAACGGCTTCTPSPRPCSAGHAKPRYVCQHVNVSCVGRLCSTCEYTRLHTHFVNGQELSEWVRIGGYYGSVSYGFRCECLSDRR